MNKQLVTKLIPAAFLTFTLSACSILPSVDGVFIDQKEEYKKAHELPSLEMPPELSSGSTRDEYAGQVKRAEPVRQQETVVQTTPLSDEQLSVELMKDGNDSYLLIRDSLRNTWRKTNSALETLGYDIDDKNRQNSKFYINLAEDTGSSNMISSLTFWKKAEKTIYIVSLDHIDSGVALRVLDKNEDSVNNDVTSKLLIELMGKLGS
ncbi:MAG: outer membrane protein assembly factor BamC [Cycloclasticus sp.]|nr:outer membrane protein assembly factor BamC [Cycloclasticus sp.]